MTAASQNTVIEVKGLSKSFNDKTVVRDLHMQVKRGEIFGFLGPNGSGKTTTIRLLCGLLTPDQGTGTCLGYDIKKDKIFIKRHVGYMTQHFSLYEDLSIQENLEFVARLYQIPNYKERIAFLLDDMKFAKRHQQLAGSLSGGWKQRLSLAAALLPEPELLLLDEPTAGVDPQARREFWDKIYELSEAGITTLVSTHYMDEAERCHRLAYIAYGDLLASGSVKEVINSAKLTTWHAFGPNLPLLARKLKPLDAVAQVALFGERLHVSGYDANNLQLALQPFIAEPSYKWLRSQPSLEDIFMLLVNQAKDNYEQ